MPSIAKMEKVCQERMDEYNEHLTLIESKYSEEAMQEYLTNPKAVYFKYERKTREECLTHEWNEEKARIMESSARKKKRMEDARIECLVERGFQAQHCFIHAIISKEESLCGYYKVTRHPTHYSFILKRNATTYLPWPIGKETILPITFDIRGQEWCYVTPEKIHTP